MRPDIGVIGGLGPAASELFYRMLNEHTVASKDQDHLNLIILSHASMPDRTEAIKDGDHDKVFDKLMEDAKMLQSCGCKGITITCNTAHYFVKDMERNLEIPIINMIESAVDFVCESEDVKTGDTIGIMSTDGTLKAGLYADAIKRKGLVPFEPSAEIQKEVMYQIYDRIKSGKTYDEESFKKIEAEFKGAGCSKVILACTELSVIKSEEGLSDWYVDAMEALAYKAITFAGKEYK